MLTDLTLTDQDAGTVIGPRDGYLVSLKLTRPPDVLNPMPRIGAHFTLSDDRAISSALKNLISYDPLSGWGAAGGVLWLNASVRYWGALKIISVPKGAVFAITLSDVPNPRRKAA